MYQLALLYLAGLVAGYGFTLLEPTGFIGADITNFFNVVGVIAMIVFGLATFWVGIKALVGSFR
ncbi:hypothetical protein P5G51_018260 [Virgibacillus sp. 179-BFC.A HS]|uniref:Uncharacterized protein n=1 Tax=Tigheibacillus jepli TaxID=3035914 RepID=A0ABU5CL21_9BACI|nr:hypothetical protein [Virgibacillus sp. 179-BFC.A HS]MDY0407025.1 hypothetical protein [Virgibacillus sp. 179-BFC.A HS]